MTATTVLSVCERMAEMGKPDRPGPGAQPLTVQPIGRATGRVQNKRTHEGPGWDVLGMDARSRDGGSFDVWHDR